MSGEDLIAALRLLCRGEAGSEAKPAAAVDIGAMPSGPPSMLAVVQGLEGFRD